MAEKYVVKRDVFGFKVMVMHGRGRFSGCAVAVFRLVGAEPDCPNAEREARNLCRRLNAAAKKGKVKR